MEPRITIITLGVSDLARSTHFYEVELGLPRHDDNGNITFFELQGIWLALFPREQLAADAGVPAAGSGFPGFTLAHNVASPEAVNALLAHVAAAGATIIKPAQQAEWGGYSGYFADPDGYLWEVAFSPFFPLA